MSQINSHRLPDSSAVKAVKSLLAVFMPLLVMVLIIGACTGGDKVSDADSIADTPLMSDSVAEADTVPLEQQPVSFATSADARAFMDTSTNAPAYRQGILYRMAEENLPYATKLLNNDYDGFIVVDKYRMKVILYDKFGREKRSYGMACAKNYGTKHKKADSRTPEGFFSVEGIYDSTEWLFTDDNGVTSEKKGQFGPRFIRLKIPTTSQIGIHGTCAPWSIGHRTSHGCIRITNENILELVKLVEVGMPVIVSPGRKDMMVNIREGYDIPFVTTGETTPSPLKEEQRETTVSDSTAMPEGKLHSDTVPSPADHGHGGMTHSADSLQNH